MKLIALDTSSAVASVALLEGDRIVYEANLNHGLTHSQKLMPLLESAMELADWSMSEVDVFAAVVGPGSFTGLRIGVSTVMGLAQACNRPVVGVSTLQVLAMGVPCFDGWLVPMLDARKAQVYTALYRWEGDSLVLYGEEKAAALPELFEELRNLPGRLLFMGDGMAAYSADILAAFPERALLAPPHCRMQRAASAAMIAKAEADAGRTMDAKLLLPRYIRLPQAEQELQRKQEKAHAASHHTSHGEKGCHPCP